MQFDQLLENIYYGKIAPSFREMEISSIFCDSRKVVDGSLFIALKGSEHNGAHFIQEALDNGASAVAVSRKMDTSQWGNKNVCILPVDDLDQFLHAVILKQYGNPSQKVRTIGITGTNGKTTVAYLIESILNEDGKQCGVIGTVNHRQGELITPALNTTPNFVDNQHFLAELERKHIPYSVMEVSSHALTQDRVHGIDFCAAVFTNLTNDHLDYHLTKENYFSAKAKLLTGLASESTAVINGDDIYGQQLCAMTKAKVVTFGITQKADVMAKDVGLNISGCHFTLVCGDGDIKIQSRMIGTHNVYNILAAVSICLAEGICLEMIQKGIERLTCVPGRLEPVHQGQSFSVFIDYAHTQDALENVLKTIRQVSKDKVILVFGCGGDRDQSKRLSMGKVAGQLADFSIVTNDNPRSEDPQSIVEQIIPGFDRDNYKVILDREEAIKEALSSSGKDDIVLIAGKGHETYQIFADKRIDFNERKIIEKILSC